MNNVQIKSLSFAHTSYLVIKNSIIGKCTLANARFSECALFSNVIFETAISICGNTSFEAKNVNFWNIIFKDLNSDAALGSFRNLKHLCEDAGYEHGIIEFHACELETYYNLYLRKNCPLPLLPEKISSWFNKAFTDYGRDIVLPLYCLYIFFAGGWSLDFLSYGELGKSSFCSFRNSIGPLVFALPKAGEGFCEGINSIASVYAFFQIITCSIIWFLIIFMIRRRFKL